MPGRSRAAGAAALAALIAVALLAGMPAASAPTRAQEPSTTPTPATSLEPITPRVTTAGDAGAARASGAPAFMSLSTAPRTLPATGQPRDALFVQLLDAAGDPATSPAPLVVRLASTDPRVATVPGTVTIPPGTAAAVVPVTVVSEGSTTLTAQADGIASAQSSLSGQSVSTSTQAAALGVAFAPRAFIAGAGGPTWLTVSVLDAPGGNPVAVAEDTEIRLVSSRPEIVRVPATVTVPANEFSVTVELVTGAEGASAVTALRSGLASATERVAVLVPSPAVDAQLHIVAVPDKLISGSSTQPRFVLQAVAGEEVALAFPCGPVQLSSSRPAALAVPDQLSPACEPGWHAVVVEGRAGAEVGTTTLTAALAGLEPGLATVEIVGATVARVTATIAPTVPMFGVPSVGWLIVELVDAGGRAAAVGADFTLTVGGPAGLAPESLTIRRGDSSTIVPLGPVAPGETPTLRVAAGALEAAEATIRPGRASLPVLPSAGSGAPAPVFEFGRWRISVLWVFIPGVIAVVGLLAVVAWSTRSPGPRSRDG